MQEPIYLEARTIPLDKTELLQTKNCDHGSLSEARVAAQNLGTEEIRSTLSKEPIPGSPASSTICQTTQEQLSTATPRGSNK